jgi:hypothetical protein
VKSSNSLTRKKGHAKVKEADRGGKASVVGNKVSMMDLLGKYNYRDQIWE